METRAEPVALGAGQGMLHEGQGIGRAWQWAPPAPSLWLLQVAPSEHADTRLLTPQHGAVMGFGERGQFSLQHEHGAKRGSRDAAGIPPLPQGAPAHPSPPVPFPPPLSTALLSLG